MLEKILRIAVPKVDVSKLGVSSAVELSKEDIDDSIISCNLSFISSVDNDCAYCLYLYISVA